jgi:CIC family chloride channel protein
VAEPEHKNINNDEKVESTLLKRDSNNIIEACFIGLITGLSAYCLKIGVNVVGNIRLGDPLHLPVWLSLPLFGLIGGAIAGAIVQFLAAETTGSGIPQVKAVLLGRNIIFDLRVALAKLIGGIVALGSGLTLGREGPTVQIGAALAGEFTKHKNSQRSKKNELLAAGAGAGLAAAFNAPIAGVLFVFEELLKSMSSTTAVVTVFACFVASLVAENSAVHGLGVDLKLSAGAYQVSWHNIPAFILLGIACGIFGCLFNKSIMASMDLYDKLPFGVAGRVALAGLISGIIASFLPIEFHSTAGPRDILVTSNANISTALLAFVDRFCTTVIAYGSGCPGGLFSPSLTLGASLGHIVGSLNQYLFPNTDILTFAKVGMGAFFTGVCRVPLTAIVIVFEMTNDFNLVMPLMLTCITAHAVGEKIFEGSIYDHLVNRPESKSD